MSTHPLWRPYEPPTPEEIARARVIPVGPEPVEVVPPDPLWPAEFRRVEVRIRAVLGDRVLAIDHIGSTSVPGLWAKPVIDLDLTVADSADEAAYVPAMEAAGFVLREHDDDRAAYADLKRTLAQQVFAADPAHEHTPQPRY